MKLILSRKGFDSSNGGMPSPIFPDGRMVSLPIPASDTPTKFNDLNISGIDIIKVVSELSRNHFSSQQNVHLDPDLDYQFLQNRPLNWKGAFGQASAAQKHLSNQGVEKNDLFLFFGWFKEVELNSNVWQYKRNAPDLHVIFGWLFVDEVLLVSKNETSILKKYPWLKWHPHMYGFNDKQNTVYISKQAMPSEICNNKAGYGVFNYRKEIQILTDKTQINRSVWSLPACFSPDDKRPALSYHSNINRWSNKNNESVTLNSVGRGQEFVLDTLYYPEIFKWLTELFI